MKKYRTYLIPTLIMILFSVTLFAEVNSNAGQYGYKFLAVPYGPVSLALAGRGVHNPGNASAYLIQPAASCEYDQRSLSLSHTAWLVDTQANCLAYSFSRRTDHFGISMRNLDYGEIENRDDLGTLIGHYNPLDLDVLANYSYRISPSLYCGVNLGVLYQKLNTATSLGLHGDVGFSLLPPFEGAKLSLAARNIGSANKTNNEKVKFPSSLEADYTHTITFGDQQLSLSGAVIKTFDADFKGSVSAEIDIARVLKLRCGYKLNYNDENLSAGVGVVYKRFMVDYGYSAFSDELTDVHSFGIGYRL